MSPQNIVAIQNITTSRKLGIAKVIVENNGVWHTNLAAPNTLLGAWVLEVESNNLMVVTNPLLGLDMSIEVWTVLVNMKDCGK
jgi:hypothetical protein